MKMMLSCITEMMYAKRKWETVCAPYQRTPTAGPEDGSLSGSTPRFSLCLMDANPLANDL